MKCKYKIGIEHSWLRGNYKSDVFGVDKTQYTDASGTTKTDIKLYSLAFKPLIYGGKKFNIWLPFHFGGARIKSEYLTNSDKFIKYYKSISPYVDVSADFDFKFLKIFKLGIDLGYRHVVSDFKMAADVFSGPMIGVGIKIERFSKR